ncbi:metallophosphoesterase [Lichenibacterium dinghuense]|uniref:metallophosphoesterase n=1 Tax=Lichenibacterium dinghuense TaxID=2895977 RepID=UPI001F1F04C6|nr:metallophosphoesterase [Lichenibacterium sp. 6Y81]
MFSDTVPPCWGGDGASARAQTPTSHPPLRIQVLSDLNVDSFDMPLPRLAPGTDAVVVAGDTCEGAEKAFAYLRAAFPPPTTILVVLGNHAFHGRTIIGELNRARELAPGYGIKLLENGTALVGGVRFVGATMWSGYDIRGERNMLDAMAAAARGSADHQRIKLVDKTSLWFTPKHARALFETSTAYLTRIFGEPWDGPTVVVTHHAPSARSLQPGWDDDPLAPTLASNLDRMVEASGAALWIHGHPYAACEYRIGATRVICNPRGSGEGNPAFDPALVVEVPR